jgi:hypothetical protein
LERSRADTEAWRLDDLAGESARRSGWPAWFFSMALHTALVVALGLLGRSQADQVGRALERTTGIALVRPSDAQDRYYSKNADQDLLSDQPATDVPAAFPTLDQLPTELTGSLPSLETVLAVEDGGPSLPGVEALTEGGRPSRAIGGGGISTQVFGVQGTGRKFVYVIDRSASMEGFLGRPMRAAIAELVASLKDLESVHQFQIIFYSDEQRVFNPFAPRAPKMMFGTEHNQRMAAEFVRRTLAGGSTRHREALELALDLRPDVIFFLTDADEPQLSAAELADLRRRNRGPTAIHTIEFGVGPHRRSNNFLVRLADQNEGRHVYIDVSRLTDTR